MDIAIAVEQHFGRLDDEAVPGVDYGSAVTYEALAETWRDGRALPTLAELEAAWAAYEARGPEPTEAEMLAARVEELEAALVDVLLMLAGGE